MAQSCGSKIFLRSLLYRPYPTFHLQKGNRFLLPSLISLSPVPLLLVVLPFFPPGFSQPPISLRLLLFFVSAPPSRIVHGELRRARRSLSRLPSLVLFPFLLVSSTLLFYGNPKHLGPELRSRRKMSLECAHDSLSPPLSCSYAREVMAQNFQRFANFETIRRTVEVLLMR